MMKPISVVLFLVFGGTALRADLSYDQTTRITGGAMMSMRRSAGAFSKQSREPIVTHVYLKGDRMAHFALYSAQITDLSNETITNIDFKRKTYSVATFAEMAQAMAALGQRMKGETGEKPKISIKVDVKATGQTREISGFAAREMLLTVETETTDPKSGAKATMLATLNMWMAKDVTGYGQMKAFYERMAKRMAWMPGAYLGVMPAGNFDVTMDTAAVAKEAAKLEGTPVLQVVRLGMKGMQAPAEAGSQQTEPRNQTEVKPEEPSSIGSVLGGRLGRLGGFGRRKKPQPEEQPQNTPQQPQQEQQTAGSPAPGALMERTVEMSGFSTASVDSTKFEVPAGFKQVENETLKGLNQQ